jgi:hypothetical protein
LGSDKRTLRERPAFFQRTAEQPDSQTPKQPRVKATFYLNSEDIVAIDRMQTDEFQRTGKKPERSELVSRAVQLLRQQTV